MLDHDLAELYQVETRTLVQAVRRNSERFPSDFMFQLTDIDDESLRSQIVISKIGRGGRRYLPLAFTEQGVAMLSGILKSERAIEVNIMIMRAFVKLRELSEGNRDLAIRINELEKKYDGRFRLVFEAIRELMKTAPGPERKRIKGLSQD